MAPSTIKVEIKRQCCEQMQGAIDDGETGISYTPKFDEFGLAVRDGGSSYITLNFCPWCGHKLPTSRRDEWFRRLEAMNIAFTKDDIPTEFKSDAWYAGSREGA
jgi:hypothetical protein